VQVEELDVEDPAQLLAAAALGAERAEADRLVDGDARRVRLRDPRQEDVDLRERARPLDEIGEERPADAGTAAGGIDVDRDLPGPPVGAAGRPRSDRRPAGDPAPGVDRDGDRVVGGAGGQPLVVATGLARLDVERRDAALDLAVVDREDPRQVFEDGGADVDRSSGDPCRLDKAHASRVPQVAGTRAPRARHAAEPTDTPVYTSASAQTTNRRAERSASRRRRI
jgi:hypothetical protein